MTFDPSRYTITVRHVMVDGSFTFRATVAELPDVADFGETQAEAYELVLDTIDALHLRAQEDGDAFPAPLPEYDDLDVQPIAMKTIDRKRVAGVRATIRKAINASVKK